MSDQPWTPAKLAKRSRDNAKLRYRKAMVTDRKEGCHVLGCNNPAGHATESGLGRWCKKHGAHIRRHGHPEAVTYSASQTNPMRRAALAWLKANPGNQFVTLTIGKVEARYHQAGNPSPPLSLRARPTSEKADAVWARLRKAGVDPLYVIAAIIGVTLTYEADRAHVSGRTGREFLRCQIAKVLMRMAGGDVRRWASSPKVMDTITGREAKPAPIILKSFPASSGRVLRIVGQQADDVCELLLAYSMKEIADFAATVPVTKASLKTPWPDRHRAKPKPRIPESLKPTGEFAALANAELAQRKATEKKRKAAIAAAIITPEQEAARQPTVKEFIAGHWQDVKRGDGA